MIVYQLGPVVAKRRAAIAAAIGASVTLAPVVLALEVLPRLGWAPNGVFWAVAVAVAVLVVARAASQYATSKRRLEALRIKLDDEAIAMENPSEILTIPRAQVARIVEIEGTLGGVRVESTPEPGSGVVLVATVPRGGERFGEMRAALAKWRPIDRRPRQGRGVRVLLGAGVVAAVFFLPFVLDDFVGRSKAVAAIIVLVAWVATRRVMRGR